MSPLLQKGERPAAAPPADKKAKMEKVSDDFSLESVLSSAPATVRFVQGCLGWSDIGLKI